MTINLSIEIALEEINKIVVVKDLLLPDYPDITTTIKQLIIKNNRNFLDLQKYIATNASLFNKGDTISDTKTICA